MAKRGRKEQLFDELDDATRDAVDRALASHANEGVASIYRRLGLAQRDISQRTFYDYAKRFRKRLKESGNGSGVNLAALDRYDGKSNAEMIEDLRRHILVNAMANLESGDAKLYETVALLSRIQAFDKLEIDRAADTRAAELHELKLTELRKSMKEAVDARTGSGEQMGREEVYDLIDSIMRGEAA